MSKRRKHKHHRRHHHHHSRSSTITEKSIRQDKIVGVCMTVVGVVFLTLGILGIVGVLSSSMFSTFMLAGVVLPFMGIGTVITAFRKQRKLDSVKCPHCGATNKKGDTFCQSCGKTFCATCPYCGAELDGSNKCPQCGQKVEI